MAQNDKLDERSGYYQAIARFFIELRGAPFFLSSKELDVVCQWEERGIPLRVVLDGIRASFEQRSYRPGKRQKPYTLDFCNSCVLKAFDLYRDRRIGRKRTEVSARDELRKTKIRIEIERFLMDIPEELDTLRPVYSKLHKKLARGKATEEDLEKAEETIERLIEKSLTPAQMETIAAEIRAEFGEIRGERFDQIFKVKALKAEREKHRIPHVSPFYY